ncbi:GAF domain-containing protein [Nocardia sp. 2]|uniref:GAF domain-containing protein n=1 Tax=Nocardia acididurans TaxID=2802282 RepID=A0ABS1MD47_9NOCA|nr:GAF domain-containing protein [Nocardia acididurans]MBL1078571.1 GAF domain-containing protein [Nocardia acididurans]
MNRPDAMAHDAVPGELRHLAAPAERLHELLEAVYAVSTDRELPTILRQLTVSAARVVDARFGAMGLLDPETRDGHRRLAEFIQYGLDEATERRIGVWPHGGGVLGAVLASEVPIRVDDLTTHPAFAGWPAGHPLMRSFLGVPVRVQGELYGNLYLADKRGGPFTPEDERIIEALAVMAGVKIANVRMLEEKYRANVKIAVMEDRERIARDLHDTVIQRIYAAGLTVQGALRADPSPDLTDRLDRVVTALDETIQDIRATIFSIQSPAVSNGLHSDITELVTSAASHLGFTPTLRQDGPLDAVPAETARQALAVLRESLSNAVRHAHATRIDVQVTAAADELRITVADNGIGLGAAPRRSGLRNLAERAENLGGSLDLGQGLDGRGTGLRWRVLLPEPAAIVAAPGTAD